MSAPLDLGAIRDRALAATPAPWTPRNVYPFTVLQGDEPDEGIISTNLALHPASDALFVASARTDVPALLSALESAYRLIRDLTDADDCWFDHHGGCQAHGYLSLEPGEKCPHQEAKELLGEVTS